jgi:hypothetical protein
VPDPSVCLLCISRSGFALIFRIFSSLAHRFGTGGWHGIGGSTRSPDGRERRVSIRDTWNTDIVEELKPEPGDIEVYKHGYSGFHETELDAAFAWGLRSGMRIRVTITASFWKTVLQNRLDTVRMAT